VSTPPPLHHRVASIRLLTLQIVCNPSRFTELPAEMPRARGLSRSARRRHRRRASGRLRYVKRTRQLWTCSCRWPSRSMDNRYIDIDGGARNDRCTNDPYVCESSHVLTFQHQKRHLVGSIFRSSNFPTGPRAGSNCASQQRKNDAQVEASGVSTDRLTVNRWFGRRSVASRYRKFMPWKKCSNPLWRHETSKFKWVECQWVHVGSC
jgi:hypothetical protein